jgi:hypothetical protein
MQQYSRTRKRIAGRANPSRQFFACIADADGYQQSLAERQWSRVGHEYRLVPVALPKGASHPKCTYLSGPNGDLLMVSSGNLMFGCFGRNVEVMDIFHSSRTPEIFTGFGEFLEALNRRADLLNPDRTWTETFSARPFRNRGTRPRRGPHQAPHPVRDEGAPRGRAELGLAGDRRARDGSGRAL